MLAGSVPRLAELVRVRREVLEGRYHAAVDLGVVAERVLLGASSGDWVSDPRGFLERTYVTDGMRRAVRTVFAALAGRASIGGETGARVVVLPSLLGGGKTHLLAFLLYALQVLREEGPRGLEEVDEHVASAARELSEAVDPGSVRVAVVAGDTDRLSAKPGMPVDLGLGWRAQTLWGYVLGLLGVPWEEWREYDERVLVPGKDALRRLIGDGPALIVIDEITSYASSTRDERYREMIITFLKNLFEAADALPRTVVVLTLPAEATEGGIGVREHDVSLPGGRSFIMAVYSMAQRVSHKVVPPINMKVDLAGVLRRRLIEASGGGVERAARLVRGMLERLRGPEMEEAARLVAGSWERFLDMVEESYPFHPLYIEVMLDIGSHVPGFERTRSLLKLTASILRGAERIGEPIIMPWHVDVADADTRALLLAQHPKKDYYEKVLLEDLGRLEADFEDEDRRETARRVLTVVWLYSIALGALLNVKRMLEKAPEARALPAYIVEPAGWEEGVTASRVLDVVEDLSRAPGFNVALMEGSKLLYPLLPDVREIVRRAYLSTGMDEAYKQIQSIAEAMQEQGRTIRRILAIARGVPAVIEAATRWLREGEDPRLLILLDPQVSPEALARELQRNNEYLLAAEFDARPEEAGTAAAWLKEHYPYTGSPGSLWELLSTMARLRAAIKRASVEVAHMGLEEPVQRSVRDKLSSEDKGLAEWMNRVLEAALRRLYSGAGGKREWVVDFQRVLPAYGGARSEPFQVVPALEEYMRNRLGLLEKPGLDYVLRIARILGRTRAERVLGEEREIIAEPVHLGDLWRYVLESRDERVSPHLMTRESFASGIVEAYRNGEPPSIAFILERGGARRILWLKPVPLQEDSSCYVGLLNRFYDEKELAGAIQGFLKARFRSVADAVLEASIAHPAAVIGEYVEELLRDEKKPRRGDGAEVRRKYYLLKCGRTGEPVELSKVYSLLRGNPWRLYEELATGYIAYRDVVVPKTYDAAIEAPEGELVYTAGSEETLRVTARISSSDYPAPIEVIARLTDAGTGATIDEMVRIANQARRPKVEEVVPLEIPVPREPGEYIIDVYTRGLYEGDNQEIHRASLRLSVKGERCTLVEVLYEELEQAVEGADRWRVEEIALSLGPETPQAVLQQGAIGLLRELLRARARITVRAAVRSGAGTIEVSASNVSARTAGRLLQTLLDLARESAARIEELSLKAKLEESPWNTVPVAVPKETVRHATIRMTRCLRIE